MGRLARTAPRARYLRGRSEHVAELGDEDGLDDLVGLLQAQSNMELVGYTAQPFREVLDAALDELLED